MLLDQTSHFSGQKEGERIILVVRRHWFNVFQNLFSILLMILLLFGGYFYLPLLFPLFQKAPYDSIFLFLENLFAMVVFILFFLVWIDYYLDVWIITDKRVVDVEQKGLFNRNVSELELKNIQDITTEVSGIIPTFLNFGDVHIQTAAEKTRFHFKQIGDPYSIKDILMNLRKKESREDTDAFRKMLVEK